MNPSSNSLCPCGSGKKYKRCCREKDRGIQELFEKFSSGQLPFRAEIVTQSGEASSMHVSQASVTRNGQTTVLLDEQITLATNLTNGEKTQTSAVSLSIPADGLSNGTIKAIGNAAALNRTSHKRIALKDNAKRLKASSESGLFVLARKRLQYDTQIEYFDFLFGAQGQSEHTDESGTKQRPHIAIYPDGNGKFIRLTGHNCEIESDMQYSAGTHQVLPQQLRIKSKDFGETIVVDFSTMNPDEFVLDDIRFVSPA